MDMWHSNNVKVILRNFAKDHCFKLHKKWSFPLRISSINVTKSVMENSVFCAVYEHWIMLIVFIYLVLILSVWLTIKPNNLRKFILEFLKKKHDQTFIFVQGVLWLSQQSMPVSPSVCDTFFSRFTQWIFLIFWMRIFCHIKVANPDFGKLDLWSR